MKNLLTIEAFADWAERQSADKEYDFMSPKSCACAQYAGTLGVMNYKPVVARPRGSFWEKAEYVAALRPWTFGDLASRLRENLQWN